MQGVVQRLVDRVRRRALVRAFVHAGVVALAWSVALAMCVGLALRAGGQDVPFVALLLGAWAAAACVSVVSAYRRRWSSGRAAREVDRALGLKDRVSSAVELGSDSRGWGSLVLAEGERAAGGIHPGSVVALHVPMRHVAWAAAGTAAFVSVWMFFPLLNAPAPAAQPEQVSSATTSAASEVVQRILQPPSVEQAGKGEFSEALREEVAALEEELRGGGLDEAGARAKAGEAASRAADELAAAGEQEQDRAAQVRAALARAGEGNAELGSELARAMQRGDVEGAAKAVRDLSRELPRMTEGARQQLEGELAAMEEALSAQGAEVSQNSRGQGEEAGGREGEVDETDAGGDEVFDQAPIPPGTGNDDAAPGERNQQGSADEKEAATPERMSERGSAGENPSQQEAAGDAEALREAVREARESLRNQGPQPASEEAPSSQERKERKDGAAQEEGKTPPSGQQGEQEGIPGESSPGSSGAREPKEAKPASAEKAAGSGEKRAEQEKPAAGEPTRNEKPSSSPASASEQPSTSNPSAPSPSSPSGPAAEGSKEGAGDASSAGVKESSGQDEGTRQRKESTPASGERTPDADGERGAEPDRSASSQRYPGGAKRNTGSQPDDQSGSPPGNGLERLARELQKTADRERGAKRTQEEAARLREQARKLLESASPEERRELERLAREMGKRPDQSQGENEPGEEPSTSDAGGQDSSGEPTPSTSAEGEPRSSGNSEDPATQPGPAPAGDRVQPGRGMRPEVSRRPSDSARQPDPAAPNASTPGAERPSGAGGPGAGDGEGDGGASPTRERPLDPRQSVPVDARRGEGERAIAELESEPGRRTGGPQPALTGAVREAAKGAERSIEQRAVPAQYADLVRRVFKRYVERGKE